MRQGMLLFWFGVSHLLLAMGPALKCDLYTNETPLEKSIFHLQVVIILKVLLKYKLYFFVSDESSFMITSLKKNDTLELVS